MGVIAGDPPAEPEHVPGTQRALQHALDIPAPDARVSDLHLRVQETLLGREQGPSAVHIDASAFEHEVGGNEVPAGGFGDAPGDLAVPIESGYFAHALNRKPAIAAGCGFSRRT